MIVGDRSRSLASLVNCWAMIAIIWKPNFHFASDHQRSQWLPTIARITIAGIESKSISISAIGVLVAIVNDGQRSQRFNGNHQCSDCGDLSDHMEIIAERSQQSKDRSDRVCFAILTIPAIMWNSIISDRDNCSDRMFSAIATILPIVTIINDHMETRLNWIELLLNAIKEPRGALECNLTGRCPFFKSLHNPFRKKMHFDTLFRNF